MMRDDNGEANFICELIAFGRVRIVNNKMCKVVSDVNTK